MTVYNHANILKYIYTVNIDFKICIYKYTVVKKAMYTLVLNILVIISSCYRIIFVAIMRSPKQWAEAMSNPYCMLDQLALTVLVDMLEVHVKITSKIQLKTSLAIRTTILA